MLSQLLTIYLVFGVIVDISNSICSQLLLLMLVSSMKELKVIKYEGSLFLY